MKTLRWLSKNDVTCGISMLSRDVKECSGDLLRHLLPFVIGLACQVLLVGYDSNELFDPGHSTEAFRRGRGFNTLQVMEQLHSHLF